ncbi:sugar transferase [Chitinibacter bivalviorum]|uniref:Sugar transferase n=1 Tax=Chitinibacter bivalviorum TaxID=2739434 RepID=A0A7H9BII9_9NEIS|nr:sugar transferase [Chitinibacter bivalviorum]QLG87781.1 sugar transferase [Chitinibacter bivalviorum]
MISKINTPNLRELEQRFSNPARRRLMVLLVRANLRLKHSFEFGVRRTWDVLAASLALVLGWPLWLLLALCIKLSDGGPILYWQQRVGYRGQLFAFPKFRSMRIDADQCKSRLLNQHADQRTFKSRNDPRITRIGRWLRRFSLDEVPQLWCVLKGEMTLVGPRPPLPNEVSLYGLHARQRLEITPGLTCIWQISGRSNIAFDGQLALDLKYIRERNIALDLRILLLTLPAVFRGHGAY